MTGRDRSRAATTLDVAAALDPSLTEIQLFLVTYIFQKKKKNGRSLKMEKKINNC